MCERRSRKIRKGSQLCRLRETRRLVRLQRTMSSDAPAQDEQTALNEQTAQTVDKSAQRRVIFELALKTISLMQKNSIIQQRLIALQKETSEFVTAVMNNPENRRRYLEHVRVYGHPTQTRILKLESVDSL